MRVYICGRSREREDRPSVQPVLSIEHFFHHPASSLIPPTHNFSGDAVGGKSQRVGYLDDREGRLGADSICRCLVGVNGDGHDLVLLEVQCSGSFQRKVVGWWRAFNVAEALSREGVVHTTLQGGK